jgi:type II secretory pathway component GspD/PulD (secretin)
MSTRSPFASRFPARPVLWAVAASLAVGAVAAAPSSADETTVEPSSYREYDVGDGRVTFDVVDTSFGDIVKERIQPKTRVNIDVAPEAADAKLTLRVIDLHWVYALDTMASKINGVLVRRSPNLLRIERPQPIEMTFTNEEISKVINLIADSANASVIVSPDVKGTVTGRLKNAPWRAALQYVVESVGKYSLVTGDYGVLRVVPTSSLELTSGTYTFRYLRPPPPYKGVVKAQASSASSGATGAAGSATTGANIVEGNPYIPSDDPSKAEDNFPIVGALRSVVAPEAGDVKYIPGANAVIYTGTVPKVARVKALCEQLDVEPPQVFIDMNFIATTNTDALNFGMKTDTGLGFNLTGAGITHRLPFAASGGGWSDVISGTNFPAPSAASFSYGTLDFAQTDLLFQFLKQDKCSKVVQAPKILALDNQAATIFVGESIRYARSMAASNQSGGLTFSVEEDENSPVNVGFQLLVIPHVIPGENKVMLLVIPSQRSLNGTTSPIPGFDRFTVSGQTIDLPRVASSTMVSEMLLRSNETAVIGGLLEDREVNGQDKLPILGDLPVVGALFRGQTRQKVKQNLLITITPRLLRGSDAANVAIGDELAGRNEKLAGEWQGLGVGAPCPPPPCAPAAPMPTPQPLPVAPK